MVMNIRSAFAVIQAELKYFGLRGTAYDLAVRVVNRIVFLKALRVLGLSEVTLEGPLPPNFKFKLISEEELNTLAQIYEYGINHILLEETRSHQDNHCYGIYDGQRLAHYLFMFVTPALMTDDLEITFSSGYAYLCATFTHPDYRGLHLNSIGVGLAGREYLSRGFRGLLTYVESNNLSSLRSLYRVGWKQIGTIHILRMLGRYLIHSDKACDSYAFRVTPVTKRSTASATDDKIRTNTAKAS
jgi:hypothetical protein